MNVLTIFRVPVVSPVIEKDELVVSSIWAMFRNDTRKEEARHSYPLQIVR